MVVFKGGQLEVAMGPWNVVHECSAILDDGSRVFHNTR